ncbi:AraC family transcriptional regulator [Brevibacillus reuszeri]|uniref:AraC family transcriptional regulator n=1 Tax=Brevibacillus reuszeri TaxID=54915 RepID=UPI00289DDE58|nr:AraC family transcriptional regulator [Brevibacillus reuszeri]
MNIKDHIFLWNQVFIKIIDIRHSVMEQGEELSAYRLPASAFLYIVRGNARVWLDRNLHRANRFHVFHGGKGMNLRIWAEEELEYYMILYKQTLALPCHQEVVKLLEKDNPFQYQYAFAPRYPLSLFEKIEQLEKEWGQSTILGKLQVKAIFYQVVYEVLWQLHQQDIEPIKSDLVERATLYIQERSHEPLTLDLLAHALECSPGHLSRLFKNKMKTSPIHYLGQVRAEKTMKMLVRTNATLQEIAEHVGFPDAHSLSRSFKKYKGLSPDHFRKKYKEDWQDPELPISMQGIAVQKIASSLYTDAENHFQFISGRELLMQKRAKIAAMTMVMCLSLLVAACSGPVNQGGSVQAPVTNSQGTSTEQSKATQQAESPAKTRIVKTAKGNVEVPAEPKRVAADQYMGHLLKLGIVPIGVRSFMLSEGWFERAGISQEVISKIEDLGEFPMNLEKLTYLEPDLIIGSKEEDIEQYQKIGTTVFLPYWTGKTTAGPLEKFRSVSEIFGKEKEAEAWITEYEKKVAEARKKIEGIIKEGETVSIVQLSEKATYVLAAKNGNYGSVTIYQMLKLPPAKSALNMKDGFESVSMEVLPEYLGDHIFVYNGFPEVVKQVMSTELWKNLPATKKNQVYLYGDQFHDVFVMEDPYSMELQLDTIVNTLLANKN